MRFPSAGPNRILEGLLRADEIGPDRLFFVYLSPSSTRYSHSMESWQRDGVDIVLCGKAPFLVQSLIERRIFTLPHERGTFCVRVALVRSTNVDYYLK